MQDIPSEVFVELLTKEQVATIRCVSRYFATIFVATNKCSVEYIYANNAIDLARYFDIPVTCNGFAKYGHVDGIKYAISTGATYDIQTMNSIRGSLLCLQYLHDIGCPWNEDTCVNNADNLQCLQYLYNSGCPCDEKTSTAAAEFGNLEVLRYLYKNRIFRCGFDTCYYAALSGNLEVLKYVRKRGCYWDEDTCVAAAETGNLAMLKYAHENGCPWDDYTYMAAVDSGNLEVLEYLSENGFSLLQYT